ncbi:DNase I-like protein [Rhizophagus irregularis]|uniref:DNase I-like protein n=1 Tax=Rhizophagus irregularis TaxID=588596 RepID=A0A2N0NLY9_9GLOM|nr:DNase I-like protein [Rhizophagus irregularis]
MSENQGTMKIIKEPDLTATTITAIIIDTNNIIDHMDLVQTEEKITQTQTIEIDIQEEIIAGIPAMDIDINSTLSTEEGGGGDIDREIKENNKNKEKANQKIKINNLLKIGILNIRGLNDENNKKNKKEKLKNYIVQEGWDITGVNETKLKSNKGKYIYKDWKDYKIRNNSVDDTHSLGSQLLICKRWIDIRTINYKEFTGYAQSIDIVLKGKENSIRLINIYMICNDKKKKLAIIETVDKWIDEAKIANLNVIVMGDFNERKINHDNVAKDTTFLDMIEEYNLIDIHTKFNNGKALTTWSNGTISTTIDFIYMSHKLINKVEIHEVLNIEKALDTDHKALTITIRIKDEWTPDNTKYWSTLRDRITVEMNKSIKEKQMQPNRKGKYQMDLSIMTIIQRLKKKITVIDEIEKIISKWRNLKGKIEDDKTTYGIRRINTNELYLINKYKSAVNRFARIDKFDEEYSTIQIDNVLDNEEKLKNIIKELRKIKTRTTSNIKIEEIKEKDQEIE